MDPWYVIKLAVPVGVGKHACSGLRYATENGEVFLKILRVPTSSIIYTWFISPGDILHVAQLSLQMEKVCSCCRWFYSEPGSLLWI
jgi:hypothetical protein